MSKVLSSILNPQNASATFPWLRNAAWLRTFGVALAGSALVATCAATDTEPCGEVRVTRFPETLATGPVNGVMVMLADWPAFAAEQIEASDLRVVRVREAVAFRVLPVTAEVLVDGKLAGLARRFSGGVLRHKEWLELSQGRHRVSIVAPGHRRQDILVDVIPTAENDRERIEIVLTQGGGGE